MIDVLCIHWRQFSSLLHASGEVWQFQCVLSELLLHVEHCFFFHTKRNSKYVLKSKDEHIMISTNLTFQIELILWKQHNVMDKLVVPGPQHHEKWSINTSKFIGQNKRLLYFGFDVQGITFFQSTRFLWLWFSNLCVLAIFQTFNRFNF